jgi:hypothetical protein
MTDTNSNNDSPVVDHATWVDGDFEVITSDGVRFRVPSYHLFSSR